MVYMPGLSPTTFRKPNNRAIFNAFETLGNDSSAVATHMNASGHRKQGRNPSPFTTDDCKSTWHRVRIWGNVQLGRDVPLEWLREDHFPQWLEAMAAARRTSATERTYYLEYRRRYMAGHVPTQQELNVLFQGPVGRGGGLSLATIGGARVNSGTVAQATAMAITPASADSGTTGVSGDSTSDDVKEESQSKSEDEDEAEVEMARPSAAAEAANNRASPEVTPTSSRGPTPIAGGEPDQTPEDQSDAVQAPGAPDTVPTSHPVTVSLDAPPPKPNADIPTRDAASIVPVSPPIDPLAGISISDVMDGIRTRSYPGAADLATRYDRLVGTIPPFNISPDNERFARQIQQDRRQKHESDQYDQLQLAELRDIATKADEILKGSRGGEHGG